MSCLRRSEVLVIAGAISAISAGAIAQITMQWPANNIAGINPAGVAVADFNLDGKADIATLVQGPDRVQFLLHTKGPLYLEGPSLTLHAKALPQDLVTADFNNNGLPDLAVAVRHPQGAVHFFNHTGKASFYQEGQVVAVGERPRGMSVGDYNNNGWLDLALVNGDSNSASVLTNKAGVFVGPVTFSTIGEPRDSAFGDIANDGSLELAVSDYDNSKVRTYHPSDWSPGVALHIGKAMHPDGVVLADLTNNGWADLATAATSPVPSLQVVHLRFNVNGEFSIPSLFSTLGGSPSRLVAADLNCDGFLDLAVTNRDTNDLTIIRSPGGPIPNTHQVIATGSLPGAITAADLNGNGALDLVVANAWSDDVTVVLNQSEPCITPPGPIGDLNGDGVVNVFDLLLLLADWGACADPVNCPADLDSDGTVNVFDLLLMLANWG